MPRVLRASDLPLDIAEVRRTAKPAEPATRLGPGRPLTRRDVLSVQRSAGNAATVGLVQRRSVQRVTVGDFYEGKQELLAGRGEPSGPGISDEAAEGVRSMINREEQAAEHTTAQQRKQARAAANASRRADQESRKPAEPKPHKEPERPLTPEELSDRRAEWEKTTGDAFNAETAKRLAAAQAALTAIPARYETFDAKVRNRIGGLRQAVQRALAEAHDGKRRAAASGLRQKAVQLKNRLTPDWVRNWMHALVATRRAAGTLGQHFARSVDEKIDSATYRDKDRGQFVAAVVAEERSQANPTKSAWLNWIKATTGWDKWRNGLWGQADAGELSGHKVHATRYLDDMRPPKIRKGKAQAHDDLLGSGTAGFHVTAEVFGQISGNNPHAYRGGVNRRNGFPAAEWPGFLGGLTALLQQALVRVENRIDELIDANGDREKKYR